MIASRTMHADQHDADARPPQPQRAAQQGRAADRGVAAATSASATASRAHLAHSWVLSLGVTRMVATSASRLSTTYTAAISMASAWTTGRS